MAAAKSNMPTPNANLARPRDGPRLQRAADDDARDDRLVEAFLGALFLGAFFLGALFARVALVRVVRVRVELLRRVVTADLQPWP
ncbi:MAG: hypothetical protein FGM45_06845 [Actinobacteria bacterium]|nr:hypothetical protein [Actinomycetota bacterium]